MPPRLLRGGFRRGGLVVVVLDAGDVAGVAVDVGELGAASVGAVAVVVVASTGGVSMGAAVAASVGGIVVGLVGSVAAVALGALGAVAGVLLVVLELPPLELSATPIAMPAAAVAPSATNNPRRRGGLELAERAPAAADNVLGGRGAGVVYADGADAGPVSASA